MTNETRGGAAAGDRLEERLADRFTVELSQADHDYRTLRVRTDAVGGAGGGRTGRRGARRWPRLLAALVGLAAVVITVILAAPVLMPATVPGSATVSPIRVGPAPTALPLVMGSDGLPTQIAGEQVYRLADEAEWQNLPGSLLLGVYLGGMPACAIGPTRIPPAQAWLLGCGPVISLKPGGGSGRTLNPGSASMLLPWFGQNVVLRVHTHDPEAASCPTDVRASCETALVVEQVVWPVLPTVWSDGPNDKPGQRVYRASDKDSFPTTGSFLLGGQVTMPDVMPKCPGRVAITTAEEDLVPYCIWRAAIDGIHVAPKGADQLSELRDRYVVARVHVDDAEAALCPVSIQAECKAAVVVEAVLWAGAPTGTVTPTPGPTGNVNPGPTPGPTISVGAGVTSGPGPADANGVPTSLDGQPVYRAATMPDAPTFLLGGKLTHDTNCAPPATPLAKAPACGFWTIDNVKVGTMVYLSAGWDGNNVVARVQRARVTAPCVGKTCTIDTIVVTEIVWPNLELPVATAPPPPAAS